MRSGENFERIVGAVARRPLVPLVAVAAIAIAGALLALRLEPSTGTDSLVSQGSDTFEQTERFKQDFGDDAIVVLVEGDLQRTLLTSDLQKLIQLEGCLSGNVPADGLRALPRPCRELAAYKPAKVVLGPGTFVNTSVQAIGQGLTGLLAQAKDGGPKAAEKVKRQLLSMALRYGITDIPSVDSPGFVSALVFGNDGKTPKPQFSYLFPSDDAALVQMRLRPDLTDAERSRTVDLVR